MLTLGSLFDGIGVFPLAASRHGIIPLWASEIERAPVSITKRHFPDMVHMGDITKLRGGEVPPVDILTFGSPCQDLSLCGHRRGFSGDRSSLFFEAIRIINEMRAETNGTYPAITIWENVAGAFSSNNGMDFRAVLHAFTDAEIPMPADGKWAAAGMVRGVVPDLAWRTLDARGFRTAQRRRRIFLVADYAGERAAEILFDPAPLHEILNDGGKGGESYAPDAGKHSNGAGRRYAEVYTLQNRKMRGAVQHRNPREFLGAIGRPDGPCPTLLASDKQSVIIHYPDAPEQDHARYLTPEECEALMGLPEGWTELGHDGKRISDYARYKALGNSIVVTCAEYIMANISKVLQRRTSL